jgi:two-component system, NtrC family, sensor histidine kinase HydH
MLHRSLFESNTDQSVVRAHSRPSHFVAFAVLDRLVAHGALAQFYSVPVALWAVSDGWIGSLAGGILSSFALFAAPGDITVNNWTIASIALLCLGLLVGLMFQRERRQKSQLQNRAEQLSSVHEKVQANFEGMKRIERLSAIGQLSAGLAHEIRNPLASIAGAAAILRRNENTDPKYVKCIEIITRECERLNGLLTNFLNFARAPAHLAYERFCSIPFSTMF